MKRLTETQSVTLIFTELPEGVRAQLERGGCLEAGAGAKDGAIRVFADLDRGLEWCEDALLEAAEDRPPTSEALRSELSSIGAVPSQRSSPLRDAPSGPLRAPFGLDAKAAVGTVDD